MSTSPPSVSLRVDGNLWMNILKGIEAVVEEANIRFLPNDLDLIGDDDDITPEDIEQYKETLGEESKLPIFERSPEFPGVTMSALGNSNASLVLLSLPPGFFKSYFAKKPTTVGINFTASDPGIFSLLKPYLSGNCELILEVFDEGVTCPFIRHTIINKDMRTKVVIKYNFIQIVENCLETNYSYCAKAVVSPQLFHKSITSMKAYDAAISIGFRNEQNAIEGKNTKSIMIACSGMMGQIQTTATVEEEEEEEEEEMAEVKEEHLRAEDFVGLFSDDDEDYIDEGLDTSRDVALQDQEDEEFGFGLSSGGSKRKRGEKSSASKKKAKKGSALCYSLDTDRTSCSSLIAYSFMATATMPVGPVTNIYWGESSAMPIVIEHDLGNGGKLAHVIAPQLTDDELEISKKEYI